MAFAPRCFEAGNLAGVGAGAIILGAKVLSREADCDRTGAGRERRSGRPDRRRRIGRIGNRDRYKARSHELPCVGLLNVAGRLRNGDGDEAQEVTGEKRFGDEREAVEPIAVFGVAGNEDEGHLGARSSKGIGHRFPAAVGHRDI